MTLLLAGLDTAKREKGMVLENIGKADVASESVAPGVGRGAEEGKWGV